MKWTVTTPPSGTVIDPTTLPYWLRIDPDIAATSEETAMLSELLSTATEYAEVQMQASLLTRTITAVYYQNDGNDAVYGYRWDGPSVTLPRGPVIAVSSVTNGSNSADITSGCTLQRDGNTDLLVLPSGWQEPLTVVYTAGYGTGYTAVDPDIRQAIRAHVATMYENRESVQDKPLSVVPHSLEAFYQRKCRTGVAG